MKAFQRIFWTLILAGCLAACAPAGTPEAATGTPVADTPQVRVREISGVVTGGGDTTPAGLKDAPRLFVYQLLTDDGEQVSVQYRALPPSPAGDQKGFVLSFHAGTVQVNDYMIARGSFDEAQKTLTVAADGDYIKTYAQKP